jgi:hypothetical protein
MNESQHAVTVLRQYPFEVGQRIHIQDGARAGDWEVIGTTNANVKLRCPISGREMDWARFCYFVKETRDAVWPVND